MAVPAAGQFGHGVFTRYVDNVPRPVITVPSAIIGLVGTSPQYQVDVSNRSINDPIRTLGDVEDAQFFGSKTQGFTIPYALDALRDNGAGAVEVVNVFDIATHKTTAQAIQYTFPTSNVIQLLRVTGTAPSQTVTTISAGGLTGTFTVTDTAAAITYTLNTDYTFDAVNGTLTRVVGGAITASQEVRVTYDYADPSLVDTDDIIGGVTNGDRTGMQALEDVYGLRGYKVKLIICPGFSSNVSVATEMESRANSLESYFLIDAPIGTTRDQAIAGRNGTSPATVFQTANRRGLLCYPHVYDTQEVPALQPLSQYLAGVIANTDFELGYWWSPSNKLISGVTSLELPLSADLTSLTTDVHFLNAAGIVTIFRDFGTGFRIWGNRSALYPSDTTPLNFIPVGRVLDIFHESLQRSSLPYVDRPISVPLVNAIVEGGNNYIRENVIQGSLVEGSRLYYDPLNNPASSLAAGRLTFNIVMMVPTPAETIIYETTLDINLLAQSLEAAA